MKGRLLRKTWILLATIGFVVFFYMIFNLYLENQIEILYARNRNSILHSVGLPYKDKGNILIELSSKNSDLFMLGSSELGSPVLQRPGNYFPNTELPADVNTIGHAYVQNLLHAINLAGNSKSFQEQKVAIVISLQWFAGEDVDTNGFMANFSELQFYEALNNPLISHKQKEYICSRFLEIEKDPNLYVSSHLLAKMYVSNHVVGKTSYVAMKPYYMLRYRFLKLKDNYDVYKYLKSIDNLENQNNMFVPKQINWKEEYAAATEMGKKECTNNEFFVYDDYYNKYLEPIDSRRDSAASMELMNSKEWGDYHLFLEICQELDIKPYIIVMSTNGKYYDYTGMEKEKREELYKKVEQMANEKNFSVLNCAPFEYEPYFYCDVMHLGWRGWLYVNQQVTEHFSKSEE